MEQPSAGQLEKKRERYRAQISAALQEEEDPLAAYDQFVKWTIESYPNRLIARSGLLELLEEATRQFKDDIAYKGDLRYLKLWLQYASHVEDPTAVYAFLLANDIGTMYAQVYEEYAAVLQRTGRRAEAEKMYLHGIKRRARPLERLKKRYADFQASPPAPKAAPNPNSSLWRDASPETQALRRNPLKRHAPQQSTSAPSTSSATSSTTAASTSGHNRYAPMLAPPVPGKRPEKLRFNLSLLFNDGVEYSVAEARARSMGLLGKKWGPPPASELPRTARVDFNDDGLKNTRNMTGRRNMGFSAGEPTVTLATKEALADVFGMYNSPEKSMRFGAVAGSKHAPVKRIEPITPLALQPLLRTQSTENADLGKTPTAFRPYVDENANRKENAALGPPPKFKPFVDDPPSKAPQDGNRRALSAKEPSAVAPPRSNENALGAKGVLRVIPEERKPFPTVFTAAAAGPLGRKDIFVDEPPQSSTSPTESNASRTSIGEAQPSGKPSLRPYVDPQPEAPFKVFSRPPAPSENARTGQKGPLIRTASDRGDPSRQPFVPIRPALGERQPLRPTAPPVQEEEPQYSPHDVEQDESYDESTASSDIDDPPIPMESLEGLEEDDSYDDDAGESYNAPLGGRFGQINVMTPITERTYEFTMSTHPSGTPNDGLGRAFVHQDAVQAAEQLAAELREDDDDETNDEVRNVEERTGTLSLSDALAVASKFNPPNPCNPFDPPIMSTLLSLIPSDPSFNDLRQKEANHLESLQRFTKKKARRASGNTTSTRLTQEDELLEIDLSGRVYAVKGKLGEGGFGAVFEAIDVHAASQRHRPDSEDDEDDEDDEEIPKVALKVVKPRNLWEFHVLRRLHLTLPAHLRRSLITPEALYAYRDESFLVLELCNQGTLLDIVNRAGKAGITQQGACLDELLVMFFAIELMRLLEGLHTAGFIHGDVKIDNCLLRLEDVPGPANAWSSIYQPSGEGGWSYKGIKMIDFGRTIDTRLFPAGQRFIAEWPTDARDCLEIREDRPWTYQTDYFGLAGILYCMLYGKYIELSSVVPAGPPSADGAQRYKLSVPFKRYWQIDLWTRLFDLLLNSVLVRDGGELPLCEEMAALRTEMETWLQANCNRGSNSLKGLLKKIGIAILGGKD